jgi:DNA adenine methylase
VPSHLSPATAASPVAPYIGGKHRLASRLVERIAAIPHITYVEPFVGMGGVFFRRPFRARAEVINDASRDVANLFRILQRHYVALMDMLRWQVTSRAEFERLSAAAADSLTDLERAVRFLYLQRCSFGGRVKGRTFGVSQALPGRFDVVKLGPALEAVHERLSGTTIECLPFDQLIRRYDRPGTLFYLDPPYFGSETDYGAELFGRDDFCRLADILAAVKGRFMMSLNDHPEVRRIFSGFRLEEVTTTYSIGVTAAKRVPELIISPPD